MQRRTFMKFGSLALVSATCAKSEPILTNKALNKKDKEIAFSVSKKLNNVKKHVGFGNFNVIGFDEMIKITKRMKNGSAFSKEELQMMDDFFYDDPFAYGFYGKRTCKDMTEVISKKEIKKIPYTGHYLYKGEPLKDYESILKDVGKTLILTSGVRGIVKQMSLYFGKIKSCDGDISLASHSIAPPGYSYHSIGDFDVGKKGWGAKNFTASFARTKEFWELKKLSYISMRYTINNLDGVRFEPWHIKII